MPAATLPAIGFGVYKLEDEAGMRGVYSDQIAFANLLSGSNGFQLDMFVIATEKIYVCTAEGGLGSLQKDFSGASLFRFELARRQSSGDLTGLFRFISSSNPNGTATAVVGAIHSVKLEDNLLSWQEDQALYRDQPLPGGGAKAVAFAAEHRFFLDAAAKLHYEYRGDCYDINPQTLARSGQPDSFPPFISVER